MTQSSHIHAGIIGGAGLTGGEMIRLLLNHPDVTLRFVHSRSNAGRPLYDVHHDLFGDTAMHFTGTLDFEGLDVIFLCLGHGESKVFLAANSVPEEVKIIDLSQDFRLGEPWHGQPFVYGLPEVFRTQIQHARYVANPGCFATAIQLSLLPMAQSGKLTETVHTNGVTGATGAGQKLQASTQFNWRNNNINAYKTLTHQHLKEITRTLVTLQPTFNATPGQQIHFIPWRGDFSRGIFVSSQIETTLSLGEANDLYKAFYKDAAFTFVADNMVDIKEVVNTNKAFLYLEKVDGTLIVHAVIDNLLKGASGQAVHNMNLMFDLPENAGLKLKAVVF